MLTCILNTLFKSHGFVFDPSEFNTISRRLLVAHDGFQGGVVAGMTWVGLGQAVSPAVFQESPVDDWLRSKFLCPMESLGFFNDQIMGIFIIFSSFFIIFSKNPHLHPGSPGQVLPMVQLFQSLPQLFQMLTQVGLKYGKDSLSGDHFHGEMVFIGFLHFGRYPLVNSHTTMESHNF